MSAALNLFGWPDFIAQVGERISIEARLILKRENRRGPRWLLVFQTDERHQVVWYTDVENELKVGFYYRVKGRVIRHRHYNAIPQTVLKNCVISNP